MIPLLDSRHGFLDPLNKLLHFPERKPIPSELATEWSVKLIPISDTFLLLHDLFVYNKKVGEFSPSWIAKVGPIYEIEY